MSDILPPAGFAAAAIALIFASPASTQTWNPLSSKPSSNQGAKQPKITARCLPPGSKRPVACGAAQTGSGLELLATGSLADAPRVLLLRQVGGGHVVKLQPKWFVDQGMALKARVPAPQGICPASARGQQLQFEIQMATSDMNQAQASDHGSLGWFQMRC